jgi:hypothetical protein
MKAERVVETLIGFLEVVLWEVYVTLGGWGSFGGFESRECWDILGRFCFNDCAYYKALNVF